MKTSDKLRISIIIATYNRCEDLRDMLDSLASMTCDGSFDHEVIVVDNNSTDATKVVAKSYESKLGKKIIYLFEPKQGKSYALNTAINKANGDILAFIDDDVVVDKNWLLNITKCFKDNQCDCVGGRILPLYSKDTPRWIRTNRDLLSGPIVCYDHGENTRVYNSSTLFPFVGANTAYKKVCFSRYGLFRTDLGPGTRLTTEDTEFFKRVEATGARLYYCGQALVWHKVDTKRMGYSYITRWWIKAGRYSVVEEGIRSDVICYFGMPRYILRDLMETMIFLFLKLSNRREALKFIKKFCINFGRGLEYKRLKLCSK